MEPRCHETREMAAELALGIVEGEERGRALQHLAECPDCRAELEKFSELADELLLLAPHREAPVGFESRVLNELLPAPQRKPRRRLRLVFAPAAAALAAAAITLAVVSPADRIALPGHAQGGQRDGVRGLLALQRQLDGRHRVLLSGVPGLDPDHRRSGPPRRSANRRAGHE